jgi:hypothetical protein
VNDCFRAILENEADRLLVAEPRLMRWRLADVARDVGYWDE